MKNVAKRRGRKPRNKSKKFLLSSFTLLPYRILYLIDAGFTCKFIAQALHISKQRLHYWLKRLQKEKLLERLGWGNYRLTELGRLLLSKSKKDLVGGEVGRCVREVRLHNVSFRCEILEGPEVGIDWKKVQMKNWSFRYGWFEGCLVFVYPRCVVIVPPQVFDSNPWRGMLRCYERALRVAFRLQSLFRMRLGPLEINRNPHFGVSDEVIREMAKYVQISSENFDLDQSPGYGEIDYKREEFAFIYANMPVKLFEIEERLNQISSILAKMSQLFEKLTSPFYSKQKPGDDRYVT